MELSLNLYQWIELNQLHKTGVTWNCDWNMHALDAMRNPQLFFFFSISDLGTYGIIRTDLFFYLTTIPLKKPTTFIGRILLSCIFGGINLYEKNLTLCNYFAQRCNWLDIMTGKCTLYKCASLRNNVFIGQRTTLRQVLKLDGA